MDIYNNPEPPHVGMQLQPRNPNDPIVEVRAIVDCVTDSTYGNLYQLVVRYPSQKHSGTYAYELVSAHELGLGLYRVIG